VEPADLQALPPEKLIAYYTYKLRDVAAMPSMTDGNCDVFGGRDTSACATALRNIGKPAVPALLALLDDDRPTRSFNDEIGGSYIMRYSDAALQILEKMANRRFDQPRGRGVYLSNLDSKARAEVAAKVQAWWASHKDVSEAEWLRQTFRERGVGAVGDDHIAADRLLAIDGDGAYAFLRELIRNRPPEGQELDKSYGITLVWKRFDRESLGDMRFAAASNNVQNRVAAYRGLLATDEPGTLPAVLKDIEERTSMVPGTQGWIEGGDRLALLNLFGVLVGSRRADACEAEARYILCPNPAVAEMAMSPWTWHNSPGGTMEAVALPYMAKALSRQDAPHVQFAAARWVLSMAGMRIDGRFESEERARRMIISRAQEWCAANVPPQSGAQDRP
jgi:hypothetical protein